MKHETAPKAQEWTKCDAYGNSTSLAWMLARFLLAQRSTFTGRSCAATRAEIERQGFDCVPGEEARRRP
jgi:hypothetical protein